MHFNSFLTCSVYTTAKMQKLLRPLKNIFISVISIPPRIKNQSRIHGSMYDDNVDLLILLKNIFYLFQVVRLWPCWGATLSFYWNELTPVPVSSISLIFFVNPLSYGDINTPIPFAFNVALPEHFYITPTQVLFFFTQHRHMALAGQSSSPDDVVCD